MTASGGVGLLRWSLAGGSSLPAGLSLGTDGAIGGAPITTGTSSFTVLVYDANDVVAAGELSLTVEAARSDLTPTALSEPASGTRGRNVNVSAAVRNQGQVKAGRFTVTFYLSVDETITAADVRLGSKTVKSLGVGGTATPGGNLSVPLSVAPGTYFLGVVVDSAEEVAETDEGNNSRAGNALLVK